MTPDSPDFTIAVFSLDSVGAPHVDLFTDQDLLKALNQIRYLRDVVGRTFVTIASAPTNSVGRPGVDSVKDGKTPDGHNYDWKKRR